jgi:hypothetical protein
LIENLNLRCIEEASVGVREIVNEEEGGEWGWDEG